MTRTPPWAVSGPLATLQQIRHAAERLLSHIQLHITEASAARLGSTIHSGKPGSKPPTLATGGQPMQIHWACRFQSHWDHPRHLRTDVIACSADVARELGQMRAWTDLMLHEPATPFALDADHQATVERVVNAYIGWDPEHAAAVESVIGTRCSAEAIRKMRRQNALDRRTGEPVPTGENLEAEVRQRLAAGRSTRAVAAELDISQTTVSRIGRDDYGLQAAA